MSRLKRKWKSNRTEFRKRLREEMTANKALAIVAISTYTSAKHRKHIMQIWELLGTRHKEAYKDYGNQLFGKFLTGEENIFKSLYFSAPEIYKEFHGAIPERLAMGDAFGVALSVINN